MFFHLSHHFSLCFSYFAYKVVTLGSLPLYWNAQKAVTALNVCGEEEKEGSRGSKSQEYMWCDQYYALCHCTNLPRSILACILHSAYAV